MARLTIFNQNVHKSLVSTHDSITTSDFHSPVIDTDIKMLCVQEPNVTQNRVAGFGPGCNLYIGTGIRSDTNNERPRAAIITKYSHVLHLPQYCTPDLVLVCVNWCGIEIYICGVYCEPGRDLTVELNDLQRVCEKLKGKPLFITGDINSKHCAWGSPVDDARSKMFYDLFYAHNLVILNNGIIPTYRCSNSSSFLDVSVCITNHPASSFECPQYEKIVITISKINYG